jgi:hypothetical protein
MIFHKLHISLLIAILLLFIINDSFGNGINPPRPKDFPVEAECTAISNSNTKKLYRVSIKEENSDHNASYVKTLEFIDDWGADYIQLYEIQKIIITSNELIEDKFIDVKLLLTEQDKFQTGKLRAAINGKILKLSGYEQNGRKSSIAITKCKEIAFVYQSSDGYDRWDGSQENREEETGVTGDRPDGETPDRPKLLFLQAD